MLDLVRDPSVIIKLLLCCLIDTVRSVLIDIGFYYCIYVQRLYSLSTNLLFLCLYCLYFFDIFRKLYAVILEIIVQIDVC